MTKSIAFTPPSLPEGQWWRITHNPKSQTKPIKVELMEKYSLELGSVPSKAIGLTYSTAQRDTLWDDMAKLAEVASGYAEVVGEYLK